MAMPTAELLTMGDKAPRIRQEGGFWSAVAYYRIDTASEMRAAGASGLPKWKDPYPDSGAMGVADLLARTREIYFTHGSDDPTTGLGGWSEARIEYAQPTGGGDLPPNIGVGYSEIEFTTSSVQVKYGIRADGSGDGPDNQPIANGQGVSKDVGGVLVHVSTYMRPDDFQGMLTRLVDLQTEQKYNNAEIRVPPILGARGPMIVPAGFAQYLGCQEQFVAGEGGLLRVTHTLKIVPEGYLAKWRQVDELGRAVSSVMQTEIAARADFSGLW